MSQLCLFWNNRLGLQQREACFPLCFLCVCVCVCLWVCVWVCARVYVRMWACVCVCACVSALLALLLCCKYNSARELTVERSRDQQRALSPDTCQQGRREDLNKDVQTVESQKQLKKYGVIELNDNVTSRSLHKRHRALNSWNKRLKYQIKVKDKRTVYVLTIGIKGSTQKWFKKNNKRLRGFKRPSNETLQTSYFCILFCWWLSSSLYDPFAIN